MSPCCVFGTIAPAVNLGGERDPEQIGECITRNNRAVLAALHSAENTHGEDLARMFGMEE